MHTSSLVIKLDHISQHFKPSSGQSNKLRQYCPLLFYSCISAALMIPVIAIIAVAVRFFSFTGFYRWSPGGYGIFLVPMPAKICVPQLGEQATPFLLTTHQIVIGGPTSLVK
jgi:hypothetical protein